MDKLNAIGRRKTSIARVIITPGTGNMTVNNRDFNTYFPTLMLRNLALKPFNTTSTNGQFDLQVNVDGGGVSGQAEAVSLGISRALIKYNAELKTLLKAEGLTTRDPRMVERKKSGQKKARKRFQFVKR